LSDLTIENTIIWNNESPVGPEIWVSDAAVPSLITISHSIVQGGESGTHVESGCTLDWGEGMIESDPLFLAPDNSDFHLTFQSPGRGSGSNAALELPDFDFEGDPRDYQGTVDIGADEFYKHLYCTGDFTPGSDIHGRFVDLPGAWIMGLIISSSVMNSPLDLKWGLFYLDSPWFFVGPLGKVSPDGILKISTTLPSTMAPYDIPMQALINNKLTNLFTIEVR